MNKDKIKNILSILWNINNLKEKIANYKNYKSYSRFSGLFCNTLYIYLIPVTAAPMMQTLLKNPRKIRQR
jgi:hypothetical protein